VALSSSGARIGDTELSAPIEKCEKLFAAIEAGNDNDAGHFMKTWTIAMAGRTIRLIRFTSLRDSSLGGYTAILKALACNPEGVSVAVES
jgi:hypothetical protein